MLLPAYNSCSLGKLFFIYKPAYLIHVTNHPIVITWAQHAQSALNKSGIKWYQPVNVKPLKFLPGSV